MLKRLKLALRIPPFPLLLKVFIVFFLLLWLNSSPASRPYSIIAFIFLSWLFYLWPLINSVDFLGYFLIFLFGALVATISLSFSALTILIISGLTLIYFLLIGVKNINFGQQSLLLLRSLLFLLVFFIFFSINNPALFLIRYLLFILAVFILFFGLFKNYPKRNLYSIVFSFLLVQVIWVINLLPIGFINQTALALVFVLAVEELALCFFSGTFNYHNIVKNITIVIALVALILALSKWAL